MFDCSVAASNYVNNLLTLYLSFIVHIIFSKNILSQLQLVGNHMASTPATYRSEG